MDPFVHYIITRYGYDYFRSEVWRIWRNDPDAANFCIAG